MLDVGCLQLATCDVVGWLVALVGWLHWLAGCIGVGWLQRCWLHWLHWLHWLVGCIGWLVALVGWLQLCWLVAVSSGWLHSVGCSGVALFLVALVLVGLIDVWRMTFDVSLP